MQGYSSFESWDETYVHSFTMKRTERSLSIAEREELEPWTWIRTHGEGRALPPGGMTAERLETKVFIILLKEVFVGPVQMIHPSYPNLRVSSPSHWPILR